MKISSVIKKISEETVVLDFPDMRQTFDYDCGAKAAQSILAYYGYDVREDNLMKYLQTTEENGTPITNIIKLFKQYGLKTISGSLTVQKLKDYLRAEYPILMPIQAWAEDLLKVDWAKATDEGHYVVAIGYKDEKIIFEDPSGIQKAYLTEEELEDRWHDFSADGTKLDHFGVVVIGEKSYRSDKVEHMGSSSKSKEILDVIKKMKKMEKKQFSIDSMDGDELKELCKQLKNDGISTYISSGTLAVQKTASAINFWKDFRIILAYGLQKFIKKNPQHVDRMKLNKAGYILANVDYEGDAVQQVFNDYEFLEAESNITASDFSEAAVDCINNFLIDHFDVKLSEKEFMEIENFIKTSSELRVLLTKLKRS